jgi:hypothetical protein
LHGGKTPIGPALPQYKNGRYSKYLPERLKERYETAAHDPDLLTLRSDIALVDSRLADVLKRVDSGESGRIWRILVDEVEAFIEDRDDKAKATLHLNEIIRLIRQGQGDWAAWDEVGKLLEQRRRLVESESKRVVQLQQMITAERAMVLLTAVLAELKDSVSKHTDKATGNRILAEASNGLRRLVAIDAG